MIPVDFKRRGSQERLGMEESSILIKILQKTNGFERQGESGANWDQKSIASKRGSIIYTAAATHSAKRGKCCNLQ